MVAKLSKKKRNVHRVKKKLKNYQPNCALGALRILMNVSVFVRMHIV